MEGSATVTARSLDGSGLSADIAVTVIPAPEIVDTLINSSTYSFVTVPGVGKIMTGWSNEGTADTIYAGVKYYFSWTQGRACPAPLRMPTTTEMSNLIAFLNSLPDPLSLWYGSEQPVLAGAFLNSNTTINWFDHAMIISGPRTNGNNPTAGFWTSSQPYYTSYVMYGNSRAPVKCIWD
ncbi:hypothetical protein FACS189451_12910 [Bacteroidia bacterium]|nr:hypothetical protein FACS189451_12910 [Bacteroidia bacterium]